jgi:phage terminase large subunit-like protein
MAKKRLTDKKFWQYIDDVTTGKIVTGKLVKLTIDRFLADLKKGDFEFDYELGERPVRFIEAFTHHWKGEKAGQRIILNPHQHFNYINRHGWLRADGTKRFRTSYKEVARKNAKTTEEALDGIYHISKSGEIGAQCYAAATKEAQATIVVNDAGRIIKRSPALIKRFQLYELRGEVKRVVFPGTSSFMAPLGRDSKSQDGLDPSKGIVDEYHEHPTNATVEVIESGMGARKQPTMDFITTAGFNKHGPCYQFRDTCIKILNGIVEDENIFVFIHSLDEDDDWNDIECWVKANPNLHGSVSLENLKIQYQKAKNQGGTWEVNFKTKHLNKWVGASSVFIQDHIWSANHHERHTVADIKGKLCYGGIDLASTTAFNAFVLFFPDAYIVDGKPRHAVVCRFFIPEDNIKELSKLYKVDLLKWINEGWIQTTPGNVTDYDYIIKEIITLREQYQMPSLSFDPWNAGNITATLTDNSIDCHELKQTMSGLAYATRQFQHMALGKTVEHFDNPVLRWMLSNVELYTDVNGNFKPDKRGLGPIDGVSAIVDAIAEWTTMKDETQKEAGIIIV